MSLTDKLKSLFSGKDENEVEAQQPPESTGRGPTPEEIAAAAAATPAIADVEPISAEGEAVVQPAGVPEYDDVDGRTNGDT